MDYLAEHQLIQDTSRRVIASNRLVLITPQSMPVTLLPDPAVSLAKQFTGRLAIPDPASVPAGAYARQALQHLLWWDDLAGRLAPTADVRAALRLVERGECALGMVYASDVLASSTVRVLMTVPATAHAEIRYPAALTTSAAKHPAALAFLQRLSTPAAVACFQRLGFTALPNQ
jgi:molybdate transport system substrate-binding protein